MQFICQGHSTLCIVTAQALQLVVGSSIQLRTHAFMIQYKSVHVSRFNVSYP